MGNDARQEAICRMILDSPMKLQYNGYKPIVTDKRRNLL